MTLLVYFERWTSWNLWGLCRCAKRYFDFGLGDKRSR